MRDQFCLGIDPGLATCGFALLQWRTVIQAWTFRTPTTITAWERVRMVTREVARAAVAADCPVALEDWCYYGEAKGKAATLVPVVVGAIMGTLDAMRIPVATLRRSDVLGRWGLTGACGKDRSHRAVDAILQGAEQLTTEHARDAAMVAYAVGMRARKRGAR